MVLKGRHGYEISCTSTGWCFMLPGPPKKHAKPDLQIHLYPWSAMKRWNEDITVVLFAAKCHGHPHGNDQSRSTLPLPTPEHVGIVPYLPMEPGQLLWLSNEKNRDKRYQKRELKEYIPTSSAWDSTILALPLCWLFLLPSQRGALRSISCICIRHAGGKTNFLDICLLKGLQIGAP